MYSALFLILGFVLLYFGGELLVKGSINISLKANISKLVIGMTVVSFATSSPELFVSISAILNDSSDIVFGNVIGSNIANIALVLGITSLIFSVNISEKTLKIDFPFLLFSTFFVGLLLLLFKSISFYSALVLLIILSVFLFYILKKSRNEINEEYNSQKSLKTSLVLNFGYIIVAILMLKFGADFLVDAAIEIANYFNVEEKMTDDVVEDMTNRKIQNLIRANKKFEKVLSTAAYGPARREDRVKLQEEVKQLKIELSKKEQQIVDDAIAAIEDDIEYQDAKNQEPMDLPDAS